MSCEVAARGRARDSSRGRNSKPLIALWLLCLTSLAAVADAACAQDRARARLSYRADASCPDESAFHDLVAVHLGYDPFDDASDGTVHVELSAHAGSYTSTLALSGSLRGARALGPSGDCADLARAAATTVSMLLDPLAPNPPTEEAPAQSPPPHTDEASVEFQVPPAAPAAGAASTEMIFGLDVGADLGLLPNVALDVALVGGVTIDRVFRVELAAQMRHTLVPLVLGGAQTALGTYGGRAGACGKFAPVLFCGDVELGAHAGTASDQELALAWHAAVGARGGIEVPVTDGVALRTMLSLGVPLARLSPRYDGEHVWEGPPIVGALSVGVVAAPGSP